MRVAWAPRSVTISNVESLARRISPPATIDCSGSHWRTVPFTVAVLTAVRASAPPIAWTARLTRSWLRCVVVAQATTRADTASIDMTRFIVPPGATARMPARYGSASPVSSHPLPAKKGYDPRQRDRPNQKREEATDANETLLAHGRRQPGRHPLSPGPPRPPGPRPDLRRADRAGHLRGGRPHGGGAGQRQESRLHAHGHRGQRSARPVSFPPGEIGTGPVLPPDPGGGLRAERPGRGGHHPAKHGHRRSQAPQDAKSRLPAHECGMDRQRSRDRSAEDLAAELPGLSHPGACRTVFVRCDRIHADPPTHGHLCQPEHAFAPPATSGRARARAADRKSTRLNSSH